MKPEMNALYKWTRNHRNIKLYLPESFEWQILKSGLISGKQVERILDAPEEYADSCEYFSWERYFTKLLMESTENSYLQYRKNRLNPVYLHEKNREAVLQAVEGIEF